MDFKNIIDNVSHSFIDKSRINGFGLFAEQNIASQATLGYLDGQKIPYQQYKKQTQFLEWNALENEILLVRPYRTKYSFINHSRTPNLVLKQNPLRILAVRDIAKGEELTLDYRNESLPKEYIENHGSTYL